MVLLTPKETSTSAARCDATMASTLPSGRGQADQGTQVPSGINHAAGVPCFVQCHVDLIRIGVVPRNFPGEETEAATWIGGCLVAPPVPGADELHFREQTKPPDHLSHGCAGVALALMPFVDLSDA
jgi:hypothetical protein